VIWIVAFVALRVVLVSACVWGLTVSRLELASLLLCVSIVYFVFDTFRLWRCSWTRNSRAGGWPRQ
jgi:hypothetical protein